MLDSLPAITVKPMGPTLVGTCDLAIPDLCEATHEGSVRAYVLDEEKWVRLISPACLRRLLAEGERSRAGSWHA